MSCLRNLSIVSLLLLWSYVGVKLLFLWKFLFMLPLQRGFKFQPRIFSHNRTHTKYKSINFTNLNVGLLLCHTVIFLSVLQMSPVVERNLQKKRGKNKRRLFLRRREAQRQKKKGNKKENVLLLLMVNTQIFAIRI